MTEQSEMPALELPNAGQHGSANGSQTGYKIEVRSSSPLLKKLGDFVIDGAWRTFSITEGSTMWGNNIPVRSWDRDMLRHAGLLSYNAAEAHRWALLAALDASDAAGSLCVETRLVEVEFKYEYSTKERGVSPPLKSGINEWVGRVGGISPRDSKPTLSDVGRGVQQTKPAEPLSDEACG